MEAGYERRARQFCDCDFVGFSADGMRRIEFEPVASAGTDDCSYFGFAASFLAGGWRDDEHYGELLWSVNPL
jgi:hypothetical protein